MASAEAQLTPMMTKYCRIKCGLPNDVLLLFRFGDFYEQTFFEDEGTGRAIAEPRPHRVNWCAHVRLRNHVAANRPIGKRSLRGWMQGCLIRDELEDARPGRDSC